MKKFILAASLFILSACGTTHLSLPYKSSNETISAFKKLGLDSIEVESVSSFVDLDYSCPASTGVISLPDNITYENYIKKSLIEELAIAEMYDNKTPKIKLKVEVKELEYFLSHNSLMSVWDVGLKIDSSNGASLKIHEHYLFDAGAYSLWSCKKIADAFMPAIQKTIFDIATSPDLKALLTPKETSLELNPPPK